ncbi:MAG: hypothetical protein ACK583_00940, partial [Cyanobacteriota bacterium]
TTAVGRCHRYCPIPEDKRITALHLCTLSGVNRLEFGHRHVPGSERVLPANLTTIAVQRIYVRQGLSRDRASLLIKDIRHALEHFECHSVQVPLTKEESGGYNHT